MLCGPSQPEEEAKNNTWTVTSDPLIKEFH